MRNVVLNEALKNSELDKSDGGQRRLIGDYKGCKNKVWWSSEFTGGKESVAD